MAFFTTWTFSSLIFDEWVNSMLCFLKISNTSLLVLPSSFANSLTLILTTSVDIHLFSHCPCESFIKHSQRCPHLLACALTQFVLLTQNTDWNLIVSTHIDKLLSGVVGSFLRHNHHICLPALYRSLCGELSADGLPRLCGQPDQVQNPFSTVRQAVPSPSPEFRTLPSEPSS